MKLRQLLIGLTLSISIFGISYLNGIGFSPDKINYSYNNLSNNLPSNHMTPPEYRYESFSRGIATPHFHSSSEISSISDAIGAGACSFDANNDGHVDILTLNGPGRIRDYGKKSWWTDHPATSLYINNGEGFFNEIEISGIPSGTPTMGCAIEDLNNDKWQDIIITSQKNNYIALNNHGKFKALLLPGGSKFSTSVTTFDYNQDNYPDIYVSNYIHYKRHQNILETNAGFLPSSNFDASKFQGENNTLLLNKGNGNFYIIEHPLLTSDQSRTLFTLIHDINNDKLPDFVLANDTGSKNIVFLSTGNISGTSNYIEANNHPLIQKKSTRSITSTSNSSSNFILSMPMGSYNLRLPKEDFLNSPLDSANYSTWGSLINSNIQSQLIYINGLLKTSIHNSNITTPQKNILFDGLSNTEKELPGLFLSDSSRTGLPLDIDNDGDLDLLITNNNGYPALLINYSSTISLNKNSSTFLGMNKANIKHIKKQEKKYSIENSSALKKIYSSSNYTTNSQITSENPGNMRSAMFNKLINSLHKNPTGKINHPKSPSEVEILMLLSYELETLSFLSCSTLNYIKDIFITEEKLIRYKKSLIPLILKNVNEFNPNLKCSLDAISYSRSKYAYDEIVRKIKTSNNSNYTSSLRETLLSLPIGSTL